jgi:hypothetical protein
MTRDLCVGLGGVAMGAALMLAFQGVLKLLTAWQNRRARLFLGRQWLAKHARFPEE